MSNEISKEEYEALKKEVEELREYKNTWEREYPGITVEVVKNMEQQLFELYQQVDHNEGNEGLITDYEKKLRQHSAENS